MNGFARVLLAAAAMTTAAVASGNPRGSARSLWLTTGVAERGAPMDRIDGSRSGFSRSSLPTSRLRIAWRATVGSGLVQGPLVDASGRVFVVTGRGEVVALDRAGSELWTASTGASAPGPAVLLSNGTLVFADGLGEAIGVRDGALRWRTAFGSPGVAHPAPLALEDGTAVLATSRDLAVLDPWGQILWRTTLPEPLSGSLIAGLEGVLAVTQSGVVWSWMPGASEPHRLGSFGAPIEGNAVLAAPALLAAVSSSRNELLFLDLTSRRLARIDSGNGSWQGAPTLWRDGGSASAIVVPRLGSTALEAVVLDRNGTKSDLTQLTTPAAADSSAWTAALIDAKGTFAFSQAHGAVGVTSLGSILPGASSSSATAMTADTLPDGCPSRTNTGAILGIAPLPPDALVVACTSARVFAVTGEGSSAEPPSP